MQKRVFALIGGIASGKSTVSEILGSLGAYIIDADVISREVTKKGSIGEAKLIERFPSCVINNEIDRRKLKEHVFNSDEELKALNDITHPLILSEIDRRVAASSGTVVVVMPLPMGLRRFGAVLNVFTPHSVRIERLMKRDNIDRALAEKIMSAQPSDEQYEKAATFTFVNDGDQDRLRASVIKWWKIYVENQTDGNIFGGGDSGSDGRP